jgi:integrase
VDGPQRGQERPAAAPSQARARRGEVTALRENCFDFTHQRIRVSANYIVKQGNRIEKPPKAGEGRLLSLDLLTCELFRERFQRRRSEAASNGVTVPDDAYAFSPDPAGRTLWNPDTITHRYRRYARRIGITSAVAGHVCPAGGAVAADVDTPDWAGDRTPAGA